MPGRASLTYQHATAGSLNHLAEVALRQRDYPRALALREEALSTRIAWSDPQSIAWARYGVSEAAQFVGDYLSALAHCEKACAVFRQVGNARGLACGLGRLGWLAHWQGDIAAAHLHLQESRALFEGSQNQGAMEWTLSHLDRVAQGGMEWTLSHLGRVASDRGDAAAARRHLGESLRCGDPQCCAWSLARLAFVAAIQEGQAEQAARLLGAVQGLSDTLRIEGPLPPEPRGGMRRRSAQRGPF